MTKHLSSLFELLSLQQFREKTPTYIGNWKISSLKAFIDGYQYACWANNIADTDPVGFDGFHDWVASHFGWYESTAGWKNIILQECNGDEEKALRKFFELYDRFKTR